MRRYDGPDGVFYDSKHEILFILEWTGGELFNIKTRKFDGRTYKYQAPGRRRSMVGIILGKHCIRLGALGSET